MFDRRGFYSDHHENRRARNATRYASKFGDLDALGYTNNILGYEALAFYVYTTSISWHNLINKELWSGEPRPEIAAFTTVLDAAILKLPAYTLQGGLVYRGYNAPDLSKFAGEYLVGSVVIFPGFTSAAFREETAFGGNVLFIIRSLNACAIWFLAADYLEDEVLFPTGCRFQVMNLERHPHRLAILLQEV